MFDESGPVACAFEGPQMLVGIVITTLVVIEMYCIAGALNFSMSGIVADAHVGKLRGRPELFNPRESGDAVGQGFQQDADARKGLNGRNGRIGIFQRDGIELLMGVAQVKHDKPQSKEVAELEASLELVERGLAFKLAVRQDIFLKRQMHRRCREFVLSKPAGYVPGYGSVGVIKPRKRRM